MSAVARVIALHTHIHVRVLIFVPSMTVSPSQKRLYTCINMYKSVMGILINFSPAVLVDVDMIRDLILNQTISVNMALLVTGGLPYSGKSTVIRKVINATSRLTCGWCIKWVVYREPCKETE